MAPVEERGSGAIPWRSPAFQTVLVSTLVLPLGVPLLSPLLPLFRDVFAVTEFRTSYLLSVYFLPSILLSPVIGTVLDRVGRRPVLVVSLLVFGGVGVGMMALTDFTHVIAVRLVQGVAAAGIFVTTVTVIADSFEGVQRNVVFGLNVAVLSTGRALYPLLGGTLARYGWSAPFVCYLAAILAGLFVFHRFEETGWVGHSLTHGSTRRTIAGLPTVEALLLYGATIGAETVAFGAILTTLPFLLAADFGASAVTTGAVITVTTVASAGAAAGNGRLARRASNPRLIATGFLVYGVSLVGMGLAPSLAVVAAVVVPFGAGIGLILPSVDAAISDLVSEDFRADALGLRNSATGLGRATGPLLFTALATVTGYRGLLLGAGVVTLACGLGALVTTKRSARRPPVL